jgi:hypothetical protein
LIFNFLQSLNSSLVLVFNSNLCFKFLIFFINALYFYFLIIGKQFDFSKTAFIKAHYDKENRKKLRLDNNKERKKEKGK